MTNDTTTHEPDPSWLDAVQGALVKLDPDNDTHWTQAGLPRLSVVGNFAGGVVSQAEFQAVDAVLTRDLARQRADAAMKALLGDEGTPAHPTREVGAVAPTPHIQPAANADGPIASSDPSSNATSENNGADSVGSAEGDVLAMPFDTVWNSQSLLTKSVAALNTLSAETLREREVSDKKLREIYAKSERAQRRLEHLKRLNPVKEPNPIQTYLKSSNRARAERGRRTRDFIVAGVNPQDVLNELDPRSPLDRAMSLRRPALGTQRPKPRVPIAH